MLCYSRLLPQWTLSVILTSHYSLYKGDFFSYWQHLMFTKCSEHEFYTWFYKKTFMNQSFYLFILVTIHWRELYSQMCIKTYRGLIAAAGLSKSKINIPSLLLAFSETWFGWLNMSHDLPRWRAVPSCCVFLIFICLLKLNQHILRYVCLNVSIKKTKQTKPKKLIL